MHGAQGKRRPVYHMTSPEGRLGDPNGLCFWNGNWHLFYQAFPTEDNRQHWGHAISRDLVHWKDLPYAIYPSPERAVYSGSTLVENNRVIAMYHGAALGNMVATSDDPLLLNWQKIADHPVIPATGSVQLPYVVFDPCLFRSDSMYYSLSGGRSGTGEWNKPIASASLFRSKDLINWEYMHPFVQGDRFTMLGDDFACPYFWPIGNRYILNFFSHNSGGQFLIGRYDSTNHKFHALSGSGPSALGPPSSAPDGKGGVVVVYTLFSGTGGVITIPRQLTLNEKDEVVQKPAAEFTSLRYNAKKIDSLKLPANKEIVLKEIKGDAMEIMAEIDPKNAQLIELNVLRSPQKEEYTRIVFYNRKGYGEGLSYTSAPGTALMPADLTQRVLDSRNGIQPVQSAPPGNANGTPAGPPPGFGRFQNSLISIETSYSSEAPNASYRAPVSLPFAYNRGETLKLRIFIDKSIVEVFVNDKQALSVSVTPNRDDSMGVSITARGQEAVLKKLEAWQIKGIYD